MTDSNNPVKESLQQNEAYILSKVPEEFHEDVQKSIADATPTPQLTVEQAKELAVELIKENPTIEASDDESALKCIESGDFAETIK